MSTVEAVSAIIPQAMSLLSSLFSRSSNSDVNYSISVLLSRLSAVQAQIAKGQYDEAMVRTQLAEISNEFERLSALAQTNAPPDMQATLVNLQQTINSMI